MSIKSNLLFLICVLVTICESAFVDTLKKCALRDNDCHKTVFQETLRSIATTGIPDLGIDKVEPVKLQNISVSVLEVVHLTMVDGYAKGIKNCILNSFIMDIDNKKAIQDVSCDLVIKGHYKLSANSPMIKDLLGNGDLTGDGNGKVKLENIRLHFSFPFYPIKKDDGEIYFKCVNEDVEYKFDILGKASFAADNIMLGKENVSEPVIKYLNENWKSLMKMFGKMFLVKALSLYFDFFLKFLEVVPAKYYITDDLTPYL